MRTQFGRLLQRAGPGRSGELEGSEPVLLDVEPGGDDQLVGAGSPYQLVEPLSDVVGTPDDVALQGPVDDGALAQRVAVGGGTLRAREETGAAGSALKELARTWTGKGVGGVVVQGAHHRHSDPCPSRVEFLRGPKARAITGDGLVEVTGREVVGENEEVSERRGQLGVIEGRVEEPDLRRAARARGWSGMGGRTRGEVASRSTTSWGKVSSERSAARRSARAVAGSVPGARPTPKSSRPGRRVSRVANCSATTRGA